MQDELTLQSAIKNFALEAQRFKINDLAHILNQSPKKITRLMKKMVESGLLEGVFTTRKDEFITKDRLKTEILGVFRNPALIK